MTTKTKRLGLIKPDNGEYTDAWEVPVNKNSDTVEQVLGDLLDEVDAAHGTMTSLTGRLDVALNPDGTLKDIPEIATARSSTVYGSESSTASFSLDDRIEKGDRETFDARRGTASLIDAMAAAADDDVHNSIISAPSNFLSYVGPSIVVDGVTSSPVVCNINGYRQTVRKQLTAQITNGSAVGTYYIYLQRNLTGDVLVDMTGGSQNSGVVAVYPTTSKLCKFTDATKNFVSLGIKPGDILEITSTGSANAYQYVVSDTSATNANLTTTDLLVTGLFTTAQTSLNYKITNFYGPSLGYTATAHSKKWAREDGKLYIGRAVFDGTQITSTYSYGLKGRFEQFVSISLASGSFNLSAISHKLGYVPREIQFFASQANDYSQVLEPLSAGDVSGASPQRSVIVSFDDSVINVKNPTSGLFYKDYAGVSQTTGYLLIVAKR